MTCIFYLYLFVFVGLSRVNPAISGFTLDAWICGILNFFNIRINLKSQRFPSYEAVYRVCPVYIEMGL
jgi:hypothetical protein